MCSLISTFLLTILAFQVCAHVSFPIMPEARRRLENFQAALVTLCGSQEDGEESKPMDCVEPLLAEGFICERYGSPLAKWGKERFLEGLRNNEVANFTKLLVKNVIFANIRNNNLMIQFGKPSSVGLPDSHLILFPDSEVLGSEAIHFFYKGIDY